MTDFLKKDLIDVKSQLKKQYGTKIPVSRESDFIFLHKRLFSLGELKYQLKIQDNERMDFLDELHSDIVYVMITAILGLKKSLFLSIRGCIEDTIRHIYYKDHPVEFLILNKAGDSQISVADNFAYLQKHPSLEKPKKLCDLINDLHSFYGISSRYVHSSSLQHFQLSKSVSSIKFTDAEFKKQILDLGSILEKLIVILIIFHRSLFDNISVPSKRMILQSVSSTNKKLIHNL